MALDESEAHGYVKSIQSTTEELKRLGAIMKDIREEKKRALERLYTWMKRKDVDTFKGFKRRKLSPKPIRPKRKPKKVLVKDSLNLFRDAGIPDPEEFYREFQKIQYVEDVDE